MNSGKTGRWRGTLAMLAGAALLGMGCAGHRLRAEEARAGSVVLGYVDTPERALDVVFKVVAGPQTGSYWTLPVRDNLVLGEGIPDGSYQFFRVDSISGPHIGSFYFDHTLHQYDFGAQAGGIKVPHPGSVVYLGAYRITGKGWFINKTFHIDTDPDQSRESVMRAALPRLMDAGDQGRVLALLKGQP